MKELLNSLENLTLFHNILWELTNKDPNIFKCEIDKFLIYIYTAPTLHIRIQYGLLVREEAISNKDIASNLKSLYESIMRQSANPDAIIINLKKHLFKI